MKSISLKLPAALSARLEAVARRRGETRSAVLRRILEAYLAGLPDAAPGSCLDLAEDLVGCVSGPRDLSTNPEHLDGFGR